MSAALAHRGPDAEGAWTSDPDERGWGALLAHRRLSILDLSAAGAQPMRDPATGAVLVYNGELYNYREIRASLAGAGESFESTGDTAVLLRALCVNGTSTLRELRGMFAFAFWDAQRRRLALARDPLGMKPLYLARNPDPEGAWSLAFASEVRALLASGLLGQPRLDPRAVASIVWNGFVVGPTTVVAGIELLSPGHVRSFDCRAELDAREFWSFPPAEPKLREGQRALAAVLQESVRLHLASDVPLGVFLSGGIDSSSIANLARKAANAPVHSFTLAFEEPEYDESRFARRIAGAIGTEHREVVLSEQQFVAQLEAALDSLDQPTFDGLNSYYMSRAVRQAGFEVALVGTGGDELFGGYTSFRDLPPLHAALRRSAWVPGAARVAVARAVVRALQRSHGDFPGQTRWAKLPEMVRRGADLVALYQLAYALFLPDLQRELVGGPPPGDVEDGLPAVVRAQLARETAARSPRAAISVLEQRLFLGERLLRDTDAASMSVSLELRLPLVDQVLLEHVSRLPDAVRYLPLRRKAVLRRVGLEGLDPALFDRPKSGFVLPFERWIRRSLGAVMDDMLRDATLVRAVGLDPAAVERLWRAFQGGNAGLYWSRVWALYVLVRWCARHGVRA